MLLFFLCWKLSCIFCFSLVKSSFFQNEKKKSLFNIRLYIYIHTHTYSSIILSSVFQLYLMYANIRCILLKEFRYLEQKFLFYYLVVTLAAHFLYSYEVISLTGEKCCCPHSSLYHLLFYIPFSWISFMLFILSGPTGLLQDKVLIFLKVVM